MQLVAEVTPSSRRWRADRFQATHPVQTRFVCPHNVLQYFLKRETLHKRLHIKGRFLAVI